jgi:hypothetical protein
MIDIKEGIEFILSHTERQFPRRIFTPKTKQMTVYSIDEMVLIFKLNDLVDCRINLYPSCSSVTEGKHPPEVVFIDLDMPECDKNGVPYTNPELVLKHRLNKTLTKINEEFSSDYHPTIISSGSGGYHIVLPLYAECSNLRELWYEYKQPFMGFDINDGKYNPNVEFLRFFERFLCPFADSEHYNHVSMKNYLVRVPGSINSKSKQEVKILQRWDGKRPDIAYVYGDFYAYLMDKETAQQKNPASKWASWIQYCKRGEKGS